MSKMTKRIGYQAYGGLIVANPSSNTIITTPGATSGTVTIANPTVTWNGTTITSSPYISSGTLYGYYDSSNEIEYKSLAPEAIHHRVTGKRLIVWEP